MINFSPGHLTRDFQNYMGMNVSIEQHSGPSNIFLKVAWPSSFKSFVTTGDNGRLGNQLSAYASVLYFQQKEGMQAVLASWQIEILSDVFKRDLLKVPELKTQFPSWLAVTWEG